MVKVGIFFDAKCNVITIQNGDVFYMKVSYK
ncbi:hypothetical protein J2S13_000210 [Oikeobacillus pervagus]|uniref:Uncharacterized protein n=1 Tax=Oikeobacillus pervagus TaxID=1325931 RepID=A0AAJ1T216_9BACI|nr:hypothetical protein [Oikeobacillus pervagus]